MKSKLFGLCMIGGVTLALLFGFIPLLRTAHKAHADGGTTYYVSASQGNDNNNGLDPSTPWQSLSKASSVQLHPGDSLLLKSGDTWTGDTLTPQGSGTASNPILISSYGGSTRPIIAPGIGVKNYAIHLVDNQGYKITNLELSNTYGGVVVYDPTTYNNDYLWVENCYFHDITGKDTGFLVSGPPNYTPPLPDLRFGTGIAIGGSYDGTHFVYSDITLTNNTFYHDDTGIDLVYHDGVQNQSWWSNVNISNSTFTQMYRTGGIVLYSTTGGTIDHVLVDTVGYQVGMFWGNAGIQMLRVKDYTIQNSEMRNAQRANNTPDGEGFDFEGDNTNVVLKDSSIHDNVGPAILFNANGGQNTNCAVDNVTMSNNNSTQYYGNIVFLDSTGGTGDIRNSTIHLLNDQQSYAAPSGWTFEPSNKVYNTEGNLVFGGSTTNTVNDTALSYSGSGWYYATTNASTYYNGDFHATSNNGDAVSYTFSGIGVSYISGKGPDRGKVAVSIDGQTMGIVDAYDSTWASQQVLYSVSGLSNGQHTITLTKQDGSAMLIDDLDIQTTSSTVNDTALSYSGSGWYSSTTNASTYYNGDFHATANNGDSVSYTFTGIGVSYISGKGPDRGKVAVSIDGQTMGVVDAYATTWSSQQVLYAVSGLSNGQHTITLTKQDGSAMLIDDINVQ